MKPYIPEQLACVKREIALRKSAYPRWVATGTMTQSKADWEIEVMTAVKVTLEEIGNGKWRRDDD